MKKYFVTCREALESKLLLQVIIASFFACVTDRKCVMTHIAASLVYENFHVVTRPFPFLML